MSKWLPKAATAFSYDDANEQCISKVLEADRSCYLVIIQKRIFAYDFYHNKLYFDKECYSVEEPFFDLLAFLEQKGEPMAGRWNPKPCVCFQRDGVGTILVIGNCVLQFNKNTELIHKHVKQTYYQALQAGMLLVGASNTDFLEGTNEHDEEQI